MVIEIADDRNNQASGGRCSDKQVRMRSCSPDGLRMASRCACCLRSTVCCLSQEAVALRLHAQSNFLARADCSEMRLPIGARRAPSEGYRDSDLVQSPFRDALIASRRHFRYWPIASFHCKAALRSLSEGSGHPLTGKAGPDWSRMTQSGRPDMAK
jgi:hypothetical protein